jgi:hypothetical protein
MGTLGVLYILYGRGLSQAGSLDFCPALPALVSPVQNIIFLSAHFFTLVVPIAQQPGQAVVLGRLSLLVSPLIDMNKPWVASAIFRLPRS